jgi:hypothetical protein
MDFRRRSNELKSEQLGMPIGTASARLKKLILFDCLQRLNEAWCFQCEFAIENVDDLSIEHKKPWRYGDNDLFWDLSNIAFSHLSCNAKAANNNRQSVNRRNVGPPGTAWCGGCLEFLELARFSKHAGRWNGLHNECKDCKRKTDHSARDKQKALKTEVA